MINLGLLECPGFWVLQIGTNNQADVKNWGTGLTPGTHGAITLSIYQVSPKDLRALAGQLNIYAREIEGKRQIGDPPTEEVNRDL